MKNSQVALICATIVAAALINAVSNVVLVQSLKNDKTGPHTRHRRLCRRRHRHPAAPCRPSPWP